jgi:hypothetical protein
MHQSALTLKLLSTAKLEVHAMVETLQQSMNGLTTMVSFTHLASNTSRTTFKDVNAVQLMFAVTAHGHHPDQIKMVSTVAEL